jgi:hypothetical protein
MGDITYTVRRLVACAKTPMAMKCGFLTEFRRRLRVYGCKDSRESQREFAGLGRSNLPKGPLLPERTK